MKIDRKTILWVAELARLSLTEEEQNEMETQLVRILDYMDVLNELDLSEVKPTAHVLGYTNVMREDIEGKSLPVEVVKKLAPRWENGHVVVPRIV
jgi:aspartyl-tRNA(Asn)/glutamyl-tRNA(Gln) amidotransferase subunit C